MKFISKIQTSLSYYVFQKSSKLKLPNEQMNLCVLNVNKSPTAGTIRDTVGHVFFFFLLSSAVCGHVKHTVPSGESYPHSHSDTSR